MTLKHASDNVKIATVQSGKSVVPVRRLSTGVSLTTAGGVKKINAPMLADRAGKIVVRKSAPKHVAPDGAILYEDFEKWDGSNAEWTPDGWSVDMRQASKRADSWTPAKNQSDITTSDGDKFYAINYSYDYLDEWLVSPSVDVVEGMSLSFLVFFDPLYLFDLSDGHVDWNTMEFIGEQEVSATLQVWVQPEGGEWTMLRDIADDYMGMSIMDLYNANSMAFEPRSYSLSDYNGKKVKFGFRYVGTDGNTIAVDAIGVGYSSVDGLAYISPFSTLYWGFDRTVAMGTVNQSIAQYPVYDPITWINDSYNDEATYSWTYSDPVTGEFVTSDEADELSVTYVPNYSSDSKKRNNLFYPPTLNATAPMSSPGSYTAPYDYFQAGGKFECKFSNGLMMEGSFFPFNYKLLDVTMITLNDDVLGAMALPVFGHDANTDDYWLKYSLDGDLSDRQDGDFNKLVGIANLLFPTTAPLVVNGVTLYGYGKGIADDAEFTATIWALNEEMSSDYSTFTKVAEAKVLGAKIDKQYSDGDLGYLCLPFDFDKPVVIKASNEHPAYFVEITGFNSDKVEYFCPLQSDGEDIMCLGYIHSYVDLSSHGVGDAYHSFKPMVYHDGNDYVDLMSSFAIGLDAEYPWLTTECKGIELSAAPQTVALGSYYDGSKLTVEAPEGIVASVAGRYDQCELTVWKTDYTLETESDIVVKGPGVEVTIPIKVVAGINSVNAADATVDALYDLSGRAVDVNTAAQGVYVARYSDGTIGKIVVK